MEWYETNGQQVVREEIRNQVLERPFLTVSDYESSDSTASFKRIAEFYVTNGQISQEDLEKVFANIQTDLLNQAIEEYKQEYSK